MEPKPYPSEWLRGVLGLAVLRIVADGPTYGYAISVALAEDGFGTIKGGTLYPLLGRAEEAGHVVTEWHQGESGPGRKFYLITEAGRAALAGDVADWTDFATHVTDFLTSPSATPAITSPAPGASA